MYKKSCCTTPGIEVGISGSISISKMLKFMLKFLCDGQGPVRQAILYKDRSCINSAAGVVVIFLEVWAWLFKTNDVVS